MIDVSEMRILIVDDMEPMFKSMRGMLKVLKVGRKYQYAQNGLEGWKMLEAGSFEMAIIDWNMPVMNGVELLGRIREDRELRDMPVVMVTAESNREIVAEAAESDIDAYILKPLTVRSLGDKISMVIENANNPPQMIVHLKQARELEEAGDIEAAIAEAKMAVTADPMSSRPIRELGYLFFKINDLENSEKCYLKATKMNKLDVFAFHHLGELYLKQDNIDRAEKCFDKAMTISPRHVDRGINFGKILVQKNMEEKAVKVFEKAINISDESLKLREEVAEFCMENNMYDYSSKLMEFIVSKVPTRYDLLIKIGMLKDKMGRHNEALLYFTDAEKKDKENIKLKLSIAKIYMKMGHMLRAEAKLKEVLKIDPNHKDAKELLKQTI